ncbi:hypothetical protein P691DRAFT_812296 [Macrolepiota fuliginosa MF-IS2]|uniref:Uncharacterized protein n=1 Tax=Macrolepiota fuliginosa MF-IS2 TaxID=1400762 RepID=A0A9P5XFZ8_9AGAR|nr:hypothetical protein P691DRAFT_812296 [Macrolepiota fuliginosa MF-IS2]
MDPPLVLTQLHDPKLIFRVQLPLQPVDCPQSPTPQSLPYDDLWDNFQRMSRAYNNLLTQNKDLSDAHHTLQDEFTNLRDLYWRLRCKNQELVDEAIHTRIESWRHAVRLEELKKELCLLQHANAHTPSSSKRKFPDIEHDADDNPGDESDADVDAWSASTSSQSHSNTDTFNTPTSGASSKIPPPPLPSLPLINNLKGSSDIVDSHLTLHHNPRAIVSTASRGEPCIREEPSAEIRTPKRPRRSYSRRDYDDDVVISTDPSAHRQQDGIGDDDGIPPIGKEHQAGTTKHARRRRTPPQTRSRTRSSRCRRVSAEQQNATAAAVAAALSGAAASNSHSGISVSPSPPERRSL